MKKRIAIITGASSGIGQEFVRQLDQCTRTIEEVWIIARRKERLLEVKRKVRNLTVRVFDGGISYSKGFGECCGCGQGRTF